MDLKLRGKLGLVTGSTKGIGLAIAVALANEGVRVIVNGRSEESVSAALAQIGERVPDAALEGFAEFDPLGPFTLKGFAQPVPAFALRRPPPAA